METIELTPAMRQYLEIKSRYPDCILFFQMGDFYEMFLDDAVTASRILDITLTTRNKNQKDAVPLCGVPCHAASSYIARLVERGFKVAICDQVEDPRKAKGIVKREVVRVVTPGLVIDAEGLEPKENNFIAAVLERDGTFGFAALDISTGEFIIAEFEDLLSLASELERIRCREILLEEKKDLKNGFSNVFTVGHTIRMSFLPPQYFSLEAARKMLKQVFPDGDVESAIADRTALLSVCGALLGYCEENQKDCLKHLKFPLEYRPSFHMILDDTACRNLELFKTQSGSTPKGTLLHVLDETVTAMGGRKLRWWMNYPLVEPKRIRERLAAVKELFENPMLRYEIRQALSDIYDLERLGARIAMEMANARDLNALKLSLQSVAVITKLLGACSSAMISSLRMSLDDMPDVRDLIERSIVDDPPPTIREGGIIREGYDEQLDKDVAISRDARRCIAALEASERQRTGISSLKVGYNSVFGYYIEVTKPNLHLVPPDYVRKQTLVGAERYVNQALKSFEQEVLSAEERRRQREYELFVEIRASIAREVRRIQKTAEAVATLDVLCSLAEVAQRNNYCCPEVDDDLTIEIREGRHPVVEVMGFAEPFVPNDTFLDGAGNRFLIITGPNMAGKSTYIRQVALIVIIAQMGSFVPASFARVGVVDRIFTRVGASDRLSRGESTFMVEMREVARILKYATRRSLIVLDEVGRGTSTFDGLSIAWAVAEYIHDEERLKSRTLFATHYYQLTELAATREGIKNYHVAVREWEDRIVFLRKITKGGTSKSYGIHVAKIAGVPELVIQRAREILQNLEKGEFDCEGRPKIGVGRGSGRPSAMRQLNLFACEDLLINELKELDVMNMTPLEALNLIHRWKEMVR